MGNPHPSFYLKRFKRVGHTIQPLLKNFTGCTEVETHMTLFPKDRSITQRHLSVFKEEFKGRLFQTQLSEIQPGKISRLRNCYPHSGHSFRYVVNQKIAVTCEIATHLFQPVITLTRKCALSSVQSQA